MKVFLVIVASLALMAVDADAKGGFSSGGGGRSSGSFSSGRSISSAPAPRPSVTPAPAPRPAVAPAPVAPKPATPTPVNPNKGSFSSATAKPATPAPAPTTRTTTTTTTTHNTTVNRSYGGNYVSPGPMYGGWGMGYSYSNGLLTGMIIANMMHPHGTVMYSGPGMYANNALLYPNGQVVNQQGVLVGNYTNGTFTPVTNGQVVAQPVPQDAATTTPVPAPQPVTIVKTGPSFGEIVGMFVLGMMCIIVFMAILL